MESFDDYPGESAAESYDKLGELFASTLTRVDN
jgi:hypothetical protein